jgi:hypothetical protein
MSSETPTGRPDPLIEEVRELRRKVSEECGHDLDRLFDKLRQIEANWPGRVLRTDEQAGSEADRSKAA